MARGRLGALREVMEFPVSVLPPVSAKAFNFAPPIDAVSAGKSECLWPSPYNEITPEAAYLWLTECWWTDNEADQLVELVPSKSFVRKFCERWVKAFTTRTPMLVEKSRRLVVSWMCRGLECWVMGIRRGNWVIIDQTHENSAEHLWRIHFSLLQLYERRPELKLRRHKHRGAVDAKAPTHVILPNGSIIKQSHQEAGASQGKGATGVSLEELSKYKSPDKFWGQALIVTQGAATGAGGWVCGIANATPSPEWQTIKLKENPQELLGMIQGADGTVRTTTGGFASKLLDNDILYVAIHYSADDDKQSIEWKQRTARGVPEREWLREMELAQDIWDGLPVYGFDKKRHTCARFTIPEDWPRVIGVDFGPINTAGVKFAIDPKTIRDEIPMMYIYRTYHKGGVTTEAHVKELLIYSKRTNGTVIPEPFVPQAVGGNQTGEDGWRNDFTNNGLSVQKPTVGGVSAGIQAVQSALEADRLQVFDDLELMILEFESYIFEFDKAGEANEEKIKNKSKYHRLDGTRYGVSEVIHNPGFGRLVEQINTLPEREYDEFEQLETMPGPGVY